MQSPHTNNKISSTITYLDLVLPHNGDFLHGVVLPHNGEFLHGEVLPPQWRLPTWDFSLLLFKNFFLLVEYKLLLYYYYYYFCLEALHVGSSNGRPLVQKNGYPYGVAFFFSP